MATWYFNVYTVTGQEKILADFIGRVRSIRAASGVETVEYEEAEETLDFENLVPGANERIGRGGALNSRFVEREEGRAVFEFETPYCSPVEVFEEVSKLYPQLKFHCEFISEDRMRGHFRAGGGEYTVEYEDVRADIFDLGLHRATPQSELQILRAFKKLGRRSHLVQLLGTGDGRLIAAVEQAGGLRNGGIYELGPDTVFSRLRSFKKHETVFFAPGETSEGRCLFGVSADLPQIRDNFDRNMISKGERRLEKPADTIPVSVFYLDQSGRCIDLVQCTLNDRNVEAFLPSVMTPDGSLFGIVAYGGRKVEVPVMSDLPEAMVDAECGMVFQLVPHERPRIVHEFSGPDGRVPVSLVLGKDGFLYGATICGGDPGPVAAPLYASDSGQQALGFYGDPGNMNPQHILERQLQATAQPLYPLYRYRYPGGCGVLFRLAPGGPLEILHRFIEQEGVCPVGQLSWAADGTLYGVTGRGGSHDLGTTYRYDTRSGQLQMLHSFTPSQGRPMGGVVQAGRALYGLSAGSKGNVGCLYRLTPEGECTILHAFEIIYSLATRLPYYPNGANPGKELVVGTDGNLYGMTTSGGPDQSGTLFRVRV
ncbi:MAG: hypothetical protein H7Y22_18650 [Gemmatimonadaceae bacterium]|nr:hypothetical protein [Gloeobacterales cyanobacterium ES-bin-141]